MFPSSTKREIRHFHVVVVQRRQRNVQKKRDAPAKFLFCQSKPIGLLPFSSPSSSLKIPNERFSDGSALKTDKIIMKPLELRYDPIPELINNNSSRFHGL